MIVLIDNQLNCVVQIQSLQIGVLRPLGVSFLALESCSFPFSPFHSPSYTSSKKDNHFTFPNSYCDPIALGYTPLPAPSPGQGIVNLKY